MSGSFRFLHSFLHGNVLSSLCLRLVAHAGIAFQARMAAAFKKCFLATDQFLGQIKKLPCASKVEQQRLDVLLEMVSKSMPWLPEAAGEASAIINASLHFSQKSRSKLLERLCGSLDSEVDSLLGNEAPEVPCGGRIKLQDYTNMVHLIPEKIWDTLLDGQKPTADCLVALCDHCQRLGLTNPSEKTYGTITCLAFWGIWQSHDVNMHTKRSTLTIAKPFIKQYLQHYQKQRPVLEAWKLKCLPNKVSKLPHPMQAVFKEHKPVEAPAACVSAALNMPCRVTNHAASLLSLGSAATMQLEFSKRLSPTAPLALADVNHMDSNTAALPFENLALGDEEPASEDEQGKAQSKPKVEKPFTPAGQPVLKDLKSLSDLSKKLKSKKIEEVESPPDPGSHAAKRKSAGDPKSLKEGTKKVDVQSTLQNLKAKTAAKKKGAAVGDKLDLPPVAKHVGSPKKKEQKLKKKNSPKKKARKPQKEKKKKEQPAEAKQKAAKATCEVKVDHAPSSKAQVVAAQVLEGKSSKLQWPDWAASKEVLLKAFPNDTKKRFSSRCYHRVLDFEIRNGLIKDQAKLVAQSRHREANALWDEWFST